MSSPEILLIDDDRRLADMVCRYLGQAGFAVSIREPPGKAWRHWGGRFRGWCCWT